MRKNSTDSIKDFHTYTWAILFFGMVFPTIGPILIKRYSYFDLFDKISIPILIAFYSFYWLKFSSAIKKGKTSIDKVRNRIEDMSRNPRLYSSVDRKNVEENLNNAELIQNSNNQYKAFIETALRYFAVIAAIVKILALITENL